MSDYEFIIIGSGAGGGTIANTLARAGKKILILERGDFLPQEPENWSPKAVFQDGRYISKDTWYDAGGQPFQPQSHYFVGGATKLFGAALFRLRPHDFGVLHHSSGTSPAWPLTYGDMEPWYTAAEQLYQVHGEHGTDPTEGPWSAQYPHPPVSHAPRIAQLSQELEHAGYHPFPAPSGVLLQQGGACIRCNACDGFPCQVAAKSDAETIAVKPILDLPNVTLVTNAEVLYLTDDGANVGSVIARVNGEIREYRTNHTARVILSAGAANSAKILLASRTANSSGQVGRNFMMHNSRAVMAIDRKPNAAIFQKTLAVHDFYYQLGSIQMVGKSCAEAMKGESALASLIPGWSLAKVAAHSIDFWLTTEDVPLPGNRVTLAPDGNIRLSYTPNDQLEADGLYRALKAMMNSMGVLNHHVMVGKSIPLAGVAHQAGTAVMGNNPATSVLDVNCKAHDLENLYVVDASFMPSIGAVNPALTIMANALRVGQHLLTKK
jgi:choline dehydrogenase-like flavoprotein